MVLAGLLAASHTSPKIASHFDECDQPITVTITLFTELTSLPQCFLPCLNMSTRPCPRKHFLGLVRISSVEFFLNERGLAIKPKMEILHFDMTLEHGIL
jgi:hypothetical protein